MKFGVNAFIWTESFERANLPLLPRIKEAGFDGIELPLFTPAQFATADIAKGLAENHLECTICSVLTGGLSMISGDAAAYGLIVTQGWGSLGKLEVETPSLIRYGQMTKDELFVSAAAAQRGVTVSNRSDTEDLVMLKHFGPGNPDAKGLLQ